MSITQYYTIISTQTEIWMLDLKVIDIHTVYGFTWHACEKNLKVDMYPHNVTQ